MLARFAKVFEVAKGKKFREHGKLLPEQAHRFALFHANVYVAGTLKKLGFTGRDKANIILMDRESGRNGSPMMITA